MKKLTAIFVICLAIVSLVTLTACTTNDDGSVKDIFDIFKNPGDSLGGGQVANHTPTSSFSNSLVTNAEAVLQTVVSSNEIPQDATHITEETEITTQGSYYCDTAIDGKITVSAEGVTLYLNNATLSNKKKVIESEYSLTITLLGVNSVSNTNVDGSNAIDCLDVLTLNGTGTLNVTATKNGIVANSINVIDATLNVTAQKDGLHAEIDKFDDESVTSQPTLSYTDGGYVYLKNATLSVTSSSDAIQADSFVYVKNSTCTLETNGGAPDTITEYSSDNGEGKGIKAGALDYGADSLDLENADYLIYVENSNIDVNANDDAIHSNNTVIINGGNLNIATGDDGIHGDEMLSILDGNIDITKCYEGLEAAKVEISGGKIEVNATDDGINAADGTTTQVNVANNNCHIIISGGEINVQANGDGIDSNGSLLISGGIVLVSGSTGGADAALDTDGNIIVNGGYLFATGSLGMVETPATNSQQYCVSFAKNSTISANTMLSLVDANGTVIFSFTPKKACQSVIISCPELQNGATYSIYGGDSELGSFTVSSTITSVGSSAGITNPGGRPSGPMGGMGGRF